MGFNSYIYIYIYIYMEREREREAKIKIKIKNILWGRTVNEGFMNIFFICYSYSLIIIVILHFKE